MKTSAFMFSTLFLLLPLSVASAGGTRGGGNVVVCFDQNPEIPKNYRRQDDSGRLLNVLIEDKHIAAITRVEAFDLQEARLRVKHSLSSKIMSIPEADRNQMPSALADRFVTQAIEPLRGVYSTLLQRIEWARKEIPIANAYFQPFGLQPENDFSTVGQIDMERCLLSSLMIQERVHERHYLHVDDRLWSLPDTIISPLSRSVTYLHELVYLLTRLKGDQTSDAARKIVAELITLSTTRTYGELFKELRALEFLPKDYEKELDYRSRVLAWMIQLEQEYTRLAREHYEKLAPEVLELIENGNFYAREGKSFYPIKDVYGYGNLQQDNDQMSFAWFAEDHFNSTRLPRLLRYKDYYEYQRVEYRDGKRRKFRYVKTPEETLKQIENYRIQLSFDFLHDYFRDEMKQYFEEQILAEIKGLPGLSEDEKTALIADFLNDIAQDEPYLRMTRKGGERQPWKSLQTFELNARIFKE